MSRRVLTSEDYVSLRDSAKSSAFRLETLDVYRVPEEDEGFTAFISGEALPLEPGVFNRQERIKQDKVLGKSWHRVHVVSVPLSDYIRYEIETGYVHFAPAGEEIKLLERSKAQELGIVNQDFWLLDDEILVLLNYDVDGFFVSQELVENEPDVVERFRCYKQTALQNAMPFDQFYTGVK